jgi:imidazole glycerol-phosphate synthase subunit HisH
MDVYVYDNGISNLKSIVSAIKYVGHNPLITNDCKLNRRIKHLILPGVGSFNSAMRIMQKNSADQRIKEFISNGGHILGICLGMQLLFEKGLEGGQIPGLGIIKGNVQLLPPPDKNNGDTLPNMGWHDISIIADSALIKSTSKSIQCYFVHEYHCVPINSEIVTMKITYGNQSICAGINTGEIYGVQFHAEKSGKTGLEMIRRFIHS